MIIARKIALPSLVAVLGLACLLSCSFGRYGEAKAVLEKMILITQRFSDAMDDAKDPKSVAKALLNYASLLKDEQESFLQIVKKYPELRASKEAPPELSLVSSRLRELDERTMASMGKATGFRDDPEVQRAFQKLTELQME